MYKHPWAEIGKPSRNWCVPDGFCSELWKSTVPPHSKAAVCCSQTLWGLRQEKQLQVCLTFQLPKRAKSALWALLVHHSSRQWHFPGKCCCAECSLSYLSRCIGPKMVCGLCPCHIQLWAAGASHKWAVQFLFPSAALFWQGWNSLFGNSFVSAIPQVGF